MKLMQDKGIKSIDQTPDGYREVIKKHEDVIAKFLEEESLLMVGIESGDDSPETHRRLAEVQGEILGREKEIEKAKKALVTNTYPDSNPD